MASKVPTSKSTASKGAGSKASASKAPSRASRAGSVSGARGSSRSSSARDAKDASSKSKGASPAADKAEAKKPVIKTADLPTLSLIDEPAPKKRVASTGKALPRIGESQPPAAPVPVVEEEVEAVQTEETVTAEDAEGGEPRKVIHIKPPIQIKELAAQMGVPPFKIIKDLMGMQIFANINQSVEPEVAGKLCDLYGFVFEREKRVAGGGVHKEEKVVIEPPKPVEEKPEAKKLRGPIITFMGHVDHGKTSLLDAIRRAKVAAGEAGGITQRIGAYSIDWKGHPITFIDTPGHAAFSAMRARGANVTDIVVLVVAADDGLMPQTLEALSHAQAAKVTIMVAINKCDLKTANPDRVKQQLQEKGLVPEDWGGDTVVCEVSAATGKGIDNLLEMMSLQAEVLELKANPDIPGRASVIEAQVEAGRGPTATVIVNTGTLRVGDPFICGNYWGKVKQLINEDGVAFKAAGPAMPAKVLGLSGLPNAGDELVVMENERSARQLSEERLDAQRKEKLATPKRATLENLFANIAADQKKVLQIVLKADMQGSLEAIIGTLNDIPQEKIDLKIIHSAVGPITESDVLLASASDAIIIGFGIKVENSANNAARKEGVQIKLFSIIYELVDQMRDAMQGLLDPEVREAVIGHAEVKQLFDLTKGMVAGSMVTDGRMSRSARARVLRRRQAVYDGSLTTLRRFTEDVKEVRAGLECGIRLGDYSEYEVGDIIECYTLEKVAQTL
ncbi:MAG: translation initiation factor [Verrucomicrobiota bacterium]|jgi:translation initiation factor IF-2